MKSNPRFRLGAWALAIAIACLLGGCAGTPTPPPPPPPLLLISLDGFRWDYCALHPAETPHLRELMRTGVSARGLIPVYPSNTFPNHYSIVTGLYPSHHGIVNNHLFDPTIGAFFHYNRGESAHDDQWWLGEPIWVTAAKQGRKSACAFWPGSEAQIKGTRPTFWQPFNYKIPFEQRLAELVGWMKLAPDQRPAVVTFYLEETNSAGHNFGPDSPELAAAVALLDGRVGDILSRLRAEGVTPNVVVVSDHGMTPCSPDRVIFLDDFLDLATVQIDFDETSAGLRPLTGTDTDATMRALSNLPSHARAYRAADLPPRFHVDPRSPRVPPVWIVPDEGWQIMRRAQFDTKTKKFPTFLKGQHGYDPALPSMRGILIANGPSFKADGSVIDPVENVHIYDLLCAALRLTPAPNDGDDRLARAFLRR
jgi:predicted AlkP superfamily pyrophosphatase or phosphodiesterase